MSNLVKLHRKQGLRGLRIVVAVHSGDGNSSDDTTAKNHGDASSPRCVPLNRMRGTTIMTGVGAVLGFRREDHSSQWNTWQICGLSVHGSDHAALSTSSGYLLTSKSLPSFVLSSMISVLAVSVIAPVAALAQTAPASDTVAPEPDDAGAATAAEMAKPAPEMQAVLDKMAELGAKPLHTLTVEQARAQPTPADAVAAVMADNKTGAGLRCLSKRLSPDFVLGCAFGWHGHGSAGASFLDERVGGPMAFATGTGPFRVQPDRTDGLPVSRLA